MCYFCSVTRKERLHKRNERVRTLFEGLSKKNPQWRVDALIDEVANKMFLAPRTIEAILRCEGSYAENTYTPTQQTLFN